MHKTYLLLASVLTLLLVGAGCNNATTNKENNSTTEIPQVKSAEKNNTETTTTTDTDTKNIDNVSSEFTLTGEVGTKKGTVNLSWSAPQDLQNKATGWKLLYDKDTDPTEPTTWWLETASTHSEKVWSRLPSGLGHIRVCAVVDDKCDTYSNDLEVDIK